MKKLSGMLAGRVGWVVFTAILIVGLVLLRGFSTMQASSVEAEQTASPTGGSLIISEFRLRGPNGTSDEFIEIYNNTGSGHNVSAASGTGYGVAASDGVLRCTIPNGTFFPVRAHFLCVNSSGYSLSSYPAGNGTTATSNATYSTGIADNVGIALFNNNTGGASFTLANRFDAVGSTAESNTLYKEGTGYPSLTTTSANYSFFRKLDPVTGLSTDTENNASDFLFADPAGSLAGAGQRLGAPAPENLSSPLFLALGSYAALPLDGTKAISAVPNRSRDLTPDPGNNSALGTISIRRRFVNNTGGNITRLRFRIIDISTFPNLADLRPRNASLVVVAAINDAATCAATGAPSTPPCTISVQGTTLETPPAQPSGGGFNSSMSAGTVTLGTPIAPGASINLQFLMGVQGSGAYHLIFQLEALPGGGAIFEISGSTLTGNTTSDALNRVSDFDGDGKSDLAVFRGSNGTWFRRNSGNGADLVTGWGLNGDAITPGDYDGDGKADLAVFRPTGGIWFVNRSLGGFTQTNFGLSTDLPVQGDYDGDGKTDIAVFRPSTGEWYLDRSMAGFTVVPFGSNGDRPVPGDYDRDGKTDVAVFRPSDGIWYILQSTAGFTGLQFGTSTDKVVPADYDGDGKTDVAVWRPSTGQWFIQRSTAGLLVQPWGVAGDIPAPGDYEGDGKADITVFRPTGGIWFRLNSSNGGFFQLPYGSSGDRPVAAGYVPVQ